MVLFCGLVFSFCDGRSPQEIAKAEYEVAYVIKSSNPDQALEKLKMVLDLVPPENRYHQKALVVIERIENGEFKHSSVKAPAAKDK